MNEINRDRLLEEIRYVTIHPEEHDQGVWAQKFGDRPSACGTFACLAGNTVIREGLGLKWYVADYRFKTEDGDLVPENDEGLYASAVVSRANDENPNLPLDGWSDPVTEGGDVTESNFENVILPEGIVPVWQAEEVDDKHSTAIATKARQILGLSWEESEALFDGENDIHILWGLAISYTEDHENPITVEDRNQAFTDRAALVLESVK